MGVPPSDSKLGAVVGRRESLGQRAREKGLGKHPVMYEREEETGVPLRDATCFELKVSAVRVTFQPRCSENYPLIIISMLSLFCSPNTSVHIL